MMIIRPPQQGHGRDNMRGWSASAVASGISGCFGRDGTASKSRAHAILAARLPLAGHLRHRSTGRRSRTTHQRILLDVPWEDPTGLWLLLRGRRGGRPFRRVGKGATERHCGRRKSGQAEAMSSKMLHSKNVQDAAVSGRRLGVLVHQRRTASSWNRRWPSHLQLQIIFTRPTRRATPRNLGRRAGGLLMPLTEEGRRSELKVGPRP